MFRIGHGYDIHRLQASGTLMLGGVAVASGLSAVAHSDGDVVIHAIVDAILGALDLGDIGQHFPDTDARWKGAASVVFLKHAVNLATEAGYHVVNADVTIAAEKPKVGPHRAAMRELLGGILGGPVSVKAGTNEKQDAVGRGEAIAATAVVLLQKGG